MRRMFLLMGLCMVVLTSCESKHHKKEEASTYLVTHPIQKDTVLTREYVAQIQSIRNIEIRAQERGYLQHIYIDEGESIKEGKHMFQIMPKLYQAEQQKAAAEAEFARIEYENTKTLADSNVVAPNELAMAKAHYEKAKAELALANAHLEFTSLKAPFDGIVDRLHLKLGSLVEEGDLLTTLSDNSSMWVYYNVPEAEYLTYKANKNNKEKKNVELLMANNNIYQHSGVIETIEGEFNNETGNIAFRATFPNPEGLLRHGETGSIMSKIPYKDALLIPQKTTFEVLSKHYVYVVNQQQKIKTREVSILAELPHLYLIKAGLTKNDTILLEGLRKVREGDRVETEFKNPEEVISQLALHAE